MELAAEIDNEEIAAELEVMLVAITVVSTDLPSVGVGVGFAGLEVEKDIKIRHSESILNKTL